MKKLIIYTTLGCHLCETAQAMLESFVPLDEYVIEMVDISESDSLLEAYALHIPVLKRVDTQAELNWPFNYEELNTFLLDI